MLLKQRNLWEVLKSNKWFCCTITYDHGLQKRPFNLGWEILPCVTYSPDLFLPDYYLLHTVASPFQFILSISRESQKMSTNSLSQSYHIFSKVYCVFGISKCFIRCQESIQLIWCTLKCQKSWDTFLISRLAAGRWKSPEMFSYGV